MTGTIKFTFYFSNGKEFTCVESLTEERFANVINTIQLSMRDGVNAVVCFEDCCIRLSECSVAEWEVLDESESKTEES